MNYDNCNKVHDFLYKNIFPYTKHQFTVTSFDDYLRRFSFLPSGKWIREMECVKLSRLTFAVDPTNFVKVYQKCCVTCNSTVKPDDGWLRIIYQLSPTLHVEAGVWAWIEHKSIQSYISLIACYNKETEYLNFADNIWNMRREGDTEDKTTGFGFGLIPDNEPEIKRPKIGFGE